MMVMMMLTFIDMFLFINLKQTLSDEKIKIKFTLTLFYSCYISLTPSGDSDNIYITGHSTVQIKF